MSTNQELRQQSVRAYTGSAYNYEDDWHALFDLEGIADGVFNDRLKAYINNTLGTSYQFLSDAMQAFAVSQGAVSWSALGEISFVGPGYDVILLAGQSNEQGQGTPFNAGIDVGDARIFQLAQSGVDQNNVIAAIDPLYHPTISPNSIGHAMAFARAYLARLPSNRNILLVPAARPSTGFTAGAGGSAGWLRDASFYNAAVTAANDAMTRGSDTNRFLGVLWCQGECDAINGVSQGDYAYYLDDLIAGMREDITGATSSWFILVGMQPDYFVTGGANFPLIDDVHENTPLRLTKTVYVAGATGTGSGDIHFNAATQRTNGANAYAALSSLSTSTTLSGAPTSLTSTAESANSVSLSWTAPTTGAIPFDYLVEYKKNADSVWSTFSHPRDETTSITVTGLDASTSYNFRVSGISTPGTGSTSSTYTVSTGSVPINGWNAALSGSNASITNSTQDFSLSSGGWCTATSTITKSSGKWYMELKVTAISGTNQIFGVSNNANPGSNFLGNFANSCGMLNASNFKTGFSFNTMSTWASLSLNDVIMVAIDIGAKKVWLGRNNTWSGDPAAGTGEVFNWVASYTNIAICAALFATGNTIQWQNTLNYSAPTGFSKFE